SCCSSGVGDQSLSPVLDRAGAARRQTLGRVSHVRPASSGIVSVGAWGAGEFRMGGANSVALRWDQPRPRAAALTSGVYVPQRAGNHRAQRRTGPRELRPAHWPRPAVAAIAPPQPALSFLQYCTFGLKLVAATLAAGTVTLFLTNHDSAQPTNPAPPLATVQMPAAAAESNLYWRPPAPA